MVLISSLNGYSNADCYQQQSESANLDKKKRWCTYHNNASHSNAECFHQRGSKFENSFLLMVKILGSKKLSLLIVPLFAAMQSFAVNVNGKIVIMKGTMSRIPTTWYSSYSRCVIPPYFKKLTASNSW